MDSSGFLKSVNALFLYYKGLGERSISSLDAGQLTWKPGEGDNSIAVIVKHLSGNMLSRWTDFLTSDGEKSWRDRDAEFLNDLNSAEAVKESWEKGWSVLLDALDKLSDDDLEKIVYIRNEGHTVMEAIHRQLAHYAYHVGQIVYLAKLIRGENWVSLSIPKGGSSAFNKKKFDSERSRKHFTG